MFKRFLSLTLLIPLLISFDGWGQTTVAMQDFDGTTTMGYSASGGTTYTGSSGTGDRPASSSFFVSSSTAYGVANTTGVLTFANVAGLGSYVSKYFEFRLASFSISSTGNGADAGDIVTVEVSTDGGTTWSSEVRVLGNGNAYWHYSTGTGNASVTFDGNNTSTDFAPSAGGNRTTDGYSTVKVNLPDAGSQARIRISMKNDNSNERWFIDDVKLVGTLLLTPPSLTADASDNNVDNNIDITFPDNSSWRSAITAVKVGGTALTVTTDYVVTAGNIQLNPSGGNSLLRTAGSKSITVEATNYTTASVTQQINAGAINSTNSSLALSAPLSEGVISTLTATAKDQYNNAIAGYVFKYDVTITSNDPTTEESYTVNGSVLTANSNDNSMTATDASGVSQYDISIPAFVDLDDGISIQTKLSDNTPFKDPFSFIAAPVPSIAISNGTTTTANVLKNTDNVILQQFNLAVTVSNTTLTSLTVTTEGTYQAADIKTDGFKLWYNSSNTFAGATQIKSAAASGPGNITFSSLSQTINSGSTGYLFVTADINASATAGRTLNIGTTAFSNIVFTSGDKTGTNPVLAGAVKTIIGLDNNTEIIAHDPQVSASTISSLAVTSGAAVEVFKFDIQEQSSIDGMPTKVTNIRLTPGSANTASWSTTIGGVVVQKDGSPVTIGTPTIADASIDIPITSGNLDIANGGTSVITVSIFLKNSGIDESKVLAFKIPVTGHGFTADATGTGFATTLTSGEFSSATFDLSVVATKLYFSSVPSSVTPNTNFSATVRATDTYNNIDLGATNSVTLTKSGGSGVLSSSSGLVQTLSAGSYTWSDLRYNTEELFEITGTTAGLVSGSSPIISCYSPATDLFISEYVEGFSNNKYIEIFNGTGSTVDLSNYKLRLFNNGASSPSNDVALVGSLTNNSTIVYKNSSATIFTGTATNNTACAFNGDDAVALFKVSTNSNVDIIGSIGEDPGTEWSSGDHSTLDKTLVRKSSIRSGIAINPGSGFPTLVTEWDVFDQNTVSDLGSHTVSYSTSAPGIQTVATGANTYPFTDKYLRLEFTGVTAGGTIQVAFYGTPPANATGLPGNVSQYRWVITNNGVADFTVNFRVKRSSFLGLTTATPGNSDVKLYKRETPGSGSFTDLGFMTYDSGNDEYYLSVTSFSEFIIQSPSEPLPVELTSFTASAKGTSVTLNWETKTEIDNNGFEVERNSTGTWQKIGFVEGHGTASSPKYYSYSDNNPLGNKLQYRLKQIDNDGDFEYSSVVEVELAPVSYTLYQNYPNPFNPSTVIRFAIPVAGNVTVNVFNTLGEKVATLLDGQLESGYHQVTFDAANLPSGLYFYEVQAGEFKSIKKMLLMK